MLDAILFLSKLVLALQSKQRKGWVAFLSVMFVYVGKSRSYTVKHVASVFPNLDLNANK